MKNLADTPSYGDLPHFSGLPPEDQADSNAALDAEVAWGRTREEIYGYRELDQEKHDALYGALTTEQRQDYDRWAEIWECFLGEEAAMAATAERGIPSWDELIRQHLAKEVEDFSTHLQAMTPLERKTFYYWSGATMRRLDKMSVDLHQTWTSPDANKKNNQEYWNAYHGFSALETHYYNDWLARTLVQRSLGGVSHSFFANKIPANELYDVWRNTGESESPIWALFGLRLFGSDGTNLAGYNALAQIEARMVTRKASDEASTSAIGRVGRIPIEALAKQLALFEEIFALQQEHDAEYLRRIDELPTEQWRSYHLWEYRRMNALEAGS